MLVGLFGVIVTPLAYTAGFIEYDNPLGDTSPTLTVADPVADRVPAALVAMQVSLRIPIASAVKVIWFVPTPVVMVPPVIVQINVQPAWFGAEASSPVVPTVVLTGAVMTGVTGAATMLALAMPGVELVPAALVTMQLRFKVPTGPDVNVIKRVPLPAVMVPPKIVQA